MDNKAIKTNINNPYKGLFSYGEEDKDLFYGRKTEQRSLSRLVRHNFLTVIFGKSGIGKTSLLHAGLFPQIREKGLLPIVLRLDYSSSAGDLTGQVRERISKELEIHDIHPKKMDGDEGAAALGPAETLWEYFHRVRHFHAGGGREIIPVLVFDQFEEIFTLGKNHRGIDAFLDELYYLIENQFPMSVKERLLNEEDVFPYADAKANVRVIISLREDYLPHLNSLKSRIRSIDRITFRVLHLNGTQGREIIGMPGGITDEQLIDDILRMFYPGDSHKELPDEKLEIEPSILSLLCFQLLEREKGGGAFITKTDKNRILADFYQSVLEGFPEEVETFIESNLLTEGGFRTPYYLEPGHPMMKTLDALVDRRILRKVHYGEKEHIEIIHDVLAPVIKEKRNIRLEEKRGREYQEELRKKRRINIMVTSAAVVSLLFAFFAVLGWIKANKQINKFIKAQVNRLTTEAYSGLTGDNTKAIRIAEAAYNMAPSNPPPRLMRVLSAAAASTLDRPFYTANMEHTDKVYSAVFSPDGSRILTSLHYKIAKLWDLHGNLLAVYKHSGYIFSAEFSPDGSRIVTASSDKTAKVWDLKGNRLADLDKHIDKVLSAVFSPDGSRIVTASDDNTAKLWDLHGNLLADFKHSGDVKSAEFSPDGGRIVTASSDKTAKLWDLKGKPLGQFKHNGSVYRAVFSPDGTRILTLSEDKTAKLWDLQGNLLANLNKHTEGLLFAVFSPDGTRIATTSWDRTVKLWDLQGNLLADYENRVYLFIAKFSPDGSRIVTAFSDKTVKVWDLQGNSLADLNKHTDKISSAVFSPDGSRIVTASSDKTAKVWDLKGNLLTDYKHNGSVFSAVFSPDGSRILTRSDNTAKLWDLKENPLTDLKKHTNKVSSAVFSPDGSRILTRSGDNTAKLWDLQGNLLADLNKHTKKVASAVFSPDGSRIVTASYDNTAKVWDLKGNLLADLNKHTKIVSSAVFSPDGGRILTHSGDNTAKLWDLQGNLLADYKHREWVYSAVFSPDGTGIVTASKDRTAKLWDLQGNPLTDYKHKGYVYSAVFSPDGSRILTRLHITAKLWDLQGNLLADYKHQSYIYSAVFSPDGAIIRTRSGKTAKLWDLQGNLLADYRHHGQVSSAVFSPDGARIVTASHDNTAKLWDLQGNLLKQLNIRTDKVHKISFAVFSRDGTRILTRSDNTVKLWDLRGNYLADYKHKGTVYSAVFSPDGSRILTASADKTAKLWYTPEAVIQWLKTADIAQLSKEDKERLGIE